MEQASALLATVNISSRVKELRDLCDKLTKERFGWDKEKAIAYLIEVLETPIDEIDENHRLTQEMTVDRVGTLERRKFKLFGKAEAMKQLCLLCGWNEAETLKHDISDPLKALITTIRGRKDGRAE